MTKSNTLEQQIISVMQEAVAEIKRLNVALDAAEETQLAMIGSNETNYRRAEAAEQRVITAKRLEECLRRDKNTAEVRLAQVEQERDRLKAALVKVRAHTSYVNPTMDLLKGLLASVERITDAALSASGEESAPTRERLAELVTAISDEALHKFYWDVELEVPKAPSSMQYNTRILMLRDGILNLLRAAALRASSASEATAPATNTHKPFCLAFSTRRVEDCDCGASSVSEKSPDWPMNHNIPEQPQATALGADKRCPTCRGTGVVSNE